MVLVPVVSLLCTLIYFYFAQFAIKSAPNIQKTHIGGVLLVFGGSFLLQAVLGMLYYGHSTDMNCFSAWSDMVYTGGFYNFYRSDAFTDYPPGYMYVLYVLGFLRSIIGNSSLILKLPAICCNIALGIAAYILAKKRFSEKSALVLGGFLAFSPVLILNSALWGQVDSVYTLFLVLCILLIYEKKLIPSYFVFALAIFIKPQALIYTPVLLFAIWENVIRKFELKRFMLHLLCGILAISSIIILSIPFGIEETINQYIATLSSYKHATVNAFNLYGALGLNWYNLNTILSIIGYVFIFALVAFLVYLYIRGQRNSFFMAGILAFGVYMLSVKMHERYAFPAVVFFLFAFLKKPQKSSLLMFILTSFSQLVNTAWILFVYEKDINYYARSPFVIVFSIINLLIFGVLIYIALKQKDKTDEFEEESLPLLRRFRSRALPSLSKKDIVLICVLTIGYGVLSFINLGSLSAPETYIDVAKETVTVDFPDNQYVQKIAVYPSCNDINETRTLILSYTLENGESETKTLTDLSVFAWNYIDFDKEITSVSFSSDYERLMLMEAAVFSEEGVIPVSSDNNLFDEQHLVPERKTYKNSTYFDEIYHARTGYEFLHGFNVYEWTHPPLGKVFISLGIKLFGMNTFGWRFIGNLFGILMIPVMYIFAKKLFRKTHLAFFTSLIFTFDFMHFVQTRIATIDVYVTFFIMLMYLFMYKFYQSSIYDKPLSKIALPLLLTGISFGFGTASKWTAIYACCGIALIFFMKMYQMYDEYYCLRELPFASKFTKICTLCVGAFIIVPAIIYVLSYIPYLSTENTDGIKTIIDNQRDIFIYHSRTVLDSEHPFSSEWYKWPIMYRPIWYYSGEVTQTIKEGISAFGNPAVWWLGIPALLYNVYLAFGKGDRKAVYLVIGYLACLLPWVPVERTTYIYHYFPCVPFVCLMIGHCFERIYYKNPKLEKKVFAIYAIVVIGLFVFFYPVLSGAPINEEYVHRALEWFDSWIFI